MIKQLCQSGAFRPFIDLCRELADEYDVEYGDDLVYQIGKRDGARQFVSDLEERIKKLADVPD